MAEAGAALAGRCRHREPVLKHRWSRAPVGSIHATRAQEAFDASQRSGLIRREEVEVVLRSSPTKIREMLQRCIRDARVAPGDLRVLDLGAGYGMVGEEPARFGVRRMVGVDIIQAAATATRRDRQDVYDDYFVPATW